MKPPEKLIVEPTTRCNFKCGACVKQSAGCRIPEGDMALSVFDRLVSLFPDLHTLILTGIGEPLMHKGLEEMIARASASMKEGTVRGIQTNGKLLTPDRAVSLLRAGLNKICISVDASDPDLFNSLRPGGSLSDVQRALDALDRSRRRLSGSTLQTGVEFVLMKQNMDQLPLVVDWAGQQGLDFILVTHVTAYARETEGQQVFMDNSEQGLALFDAYKKKAAARGLYLETYGSIAWKFYRTKEEAAVCSLVKEMKEEALANDLYVNLFHLLGEDRAYYRKVRGIFNRCRELADRWGFP